MRLIGTAVITLTAAAGIALTVIMAMIQDYYISRNMPLSGDLAAMQCFVMLLGKDYVQTRAPVYARKYIHPPKRY